MTVLSAIKILNALMGIGMEAVQLRQMMQVIQTAHEQGRDLTDKEVDHAFSQLDQADKDLATVIAKRVKEKG